MLNVLNYHLVIIINQLGGLSWSQITSVPNKSGGGWLSITSDSTGNVLAAVMGNDPNNYNHAGQGFISTNG